MTATAEPTTDSGALSHRQVMAILSGLLIGMFLASLDQTVVSTAIRTIGDELHGLSIQAWVTTAFLITSTIATPLYGKLSDIYGRKPLYLFAISTFILGSALCGLANSMYMLAAFRAVQGIGAGGLISLALAIIGDVIPPRERARYQGYFMGVFGASSVLGPVIGGFFAGQATLLGISGWRWIFYVNVPIGIVALGVVYRRLNLIHYRQNHRIDWWGAAALILGLVPLLIVAEQGREWGWGSPAALACYLLGVAGVVAFLRIEGILGNEALLPLRLFRIRNFSVGSALSFVAGAGMFGGITCVPLYLQIVRGASPTKSGLLMTPLVIGIILATFAAGQLTSRTGRYKILPVIGGFLVVIGMSLMATIGSDTAYWAIDIFMALFGGGIGLLMQATSLTMQTAVDARDMGVATSSSNFFRSVGGTLGAAVFLSVLFTRAAHEIPSEYAKAQGTDAFKAAAAAHPDQIKAVTSGATSLNDTSFLNSLTAVIKRPFLDGFSNALDLVFLIVAVVLVLTIALAIAIKEIPLRLVSGQQARAAEEQAAAAKGAEDAGRATHDSDVAGAVALESGSPGRSG
jgi:EmrB/QacA subfamily drug resistance transporter